MLRVKHGDRAAFAILHERYNRLIHSFFWGLGADSHTALDLGQETFLRIWQHRSRYAATGSFPTYALTFARFVWLEHSRSQRKGGNGSLDDTKKLIEGLTAPSTGRPDTRAFRSEISEQIVKAMSRLPNDQREAFVLQVVHGLSAADAASVMQCPVNTARSRKILALKKLRQHLRILRNVGTDTYAGRHR